MAEQQSQLYYQDGAPIAPADVAKAVAEGKAFSLGDDVRVSTASGKGGTVKRDQLANVMAQQGAAVETVAEGKQRALQKDAESLSGMAKTAGESLVRGATWGFGDLANFYDKEGKARALARMQYNPGISTGFELGGAVTSGLLASLLSGGAGAGAAAEGVGSAAARSGARSLLGRAAALGARGAAEGAVMGAGHEVSQAALHDVPLTAEQLLAGAWEGAEAGGLLGGGLGVLGGAAGRGLRAVRGSRTLREGAQGLADTAALGALGGKGRSELGRELLRYEFETGELAGQKLLRAGDTAEGIAQRVQAAQTETAGKLQAMRAQLDDAFTRHPPPDLKQALAQADEVLQPLRGSPVPAERAQAARVDSQLQGFREAAAGEPIEVKLPDGTTTQQPRAPLTFTQLEQLREGIQLPKGASPETAKAFEKVERIISEPLDKVTPQEYAETKQRLARLTEVQELAKKAEQQQGGGGLLSGIGMGTVMSALTGNVGGVLAGGASGIANKLVQDRGRSVLAVMADRAAQATSRLDSAARVAAMVESPKRLAAPVAVNVARLFDRYSKDLDQPDEEVAKHAGAIAGELNSYSPDLASAVTERWLADRAYLKSIAPTPTTNANQTLTPKAAKASYSFDQKKQFVDAATALERPLSVFDDIARGELPLSKIEALQERRPELWQQMRTTVVRYTAEREEELPYSRRMLLGVAFDFPSDWSMVNVGTIQQSLATPEKAQTDPRAAPSKVNDQPGEAMKPGGF